MKCNIMKPNAIQYIIIQVNVMECNANITEYDKIPCSTI